MWTPRFEHWLSVALALGLGVAAMCTSCHARPRMGECELPNTPEGFKLYQCEASLDNFSHVMCTYVSTTNETLCTMIAFTTDCKSWETQGAKCTTWEELQKSALPTSYVEAL